MAGIIKTSINLTAIPKDKIIVGKKGKYIPIAITINDEPDQFNNQGYVTVVASTETTFPIIRRTFKLLIPGFSIMRTQRTNPLCFTHF